MNYEYIQDTVNCINDIDCIDNREIRGCSFAEVEHLKALLNPHPLPLAYEEFLEFGGHGIVDLLQTSNFYYSDVCANYENDKVHLLYEEGGFFHKEFNSSLNINKRLFLCYYHQGYFMRVFYLTYFDDNPEMFFYESGAIYTSFVVSNMTFSEYLLAECQQYAQQTKELYNNLSPTTRNKFMSYKKMIWDLIEELELYIAQYFSETNEYIYAAYLKNAANLNQILMPFSTNRLDALKYNLGKKFEEANLNNIELREMVIKMNKLEQLGKDLLG